ncbi:hypothetical protein [Streptomyces sp. NBC_00470]|uniref:hypothetical protein n=1 Tax=Streptomyces sp. NBC_00470 TaxID=2975753 RepID=UPI0030E3DCA0
MGIGDMISKGIQASGIGSGAAADITRAAGGGKMLDKAWNLPGVKQVKDATHWDMGIDKGHYDAEAKAMGKTGGDKLKDAAVALGSAATLGAGAGALASKGAAGAATSTAGRAATTEGASTGSKIMGAAKKAQPFLSGAQFGAHMGGNNGGGQQQAPQQMDPAAGSRIL